MPQTAPQTQSTINHLTSIITGSIGNLVEWFDWYAYSVFALYFAGSFFPQNNETMQLLNTAGIFAIGFLMRPLGGLLMGTYSDRKGRKAALTLSVLMMSGGSLLIAIVPGYNSIGVAAPIILVMARMVQGISVGGEYGTVATYLSEMAPKDLRGFYSSFQYVTGIMGQLIALGILILLQKILLTPQQLANWGWRIPFAIGAVLGLVAFYLRRNMAESTSFTNEKKSKEKRGSLITLFKYPRETFTIIGFTIGATVSFYTFTSYTQRFLVNTAGFSKADSTLISIIVLTVFMLVQPLAGLLGDKFGFKRMMIIYGILAATTTIPIMYELGATHDFWAATGLIMVALLVLSLNTSISAILKAELFPVAIRSLGVSLPYALTVAIFGGSAEFVALKLKSLGTAHYFYWYLTACIVISLITSFSLRGSKYSRMEE